jgi:hypothetical protein
MPVYFDSREVTKKDLALAKSSWDILETDLCPLFLEQRLSLPAEQCPFRNTVAWFYHVYYNRLLVSYPVCLSLSHVISFLLLNLFCCCAESYDKVFGRRGDRGNV